MKSRPKKMGDVRPSKMTDKSEEGEVCISALEGRFTRAASNLSASRQELLRQILDNPQDTYFLSSRELAKRYDVDPATIVRTIRVLGYERYADFLADLRSHFVSRITPYRLMAATTNERRGMADHINYSFEMELRNLQVLRSSLDAARVVDIAKQIHRARRIVVIGVDLAVTLSIIIKYGLVTLGHDAEAPEGSSGNLQQKIDLLGPKDLLIGISFGRCLRATVDSITRAHERNVPTFGITDNEMSPVARFADSFWVTSIANPSFHGSYVAPVAAINVLLLVCAHLNPQRSLELLRQKEQEFRSGSRWYSPVRAEEPRQIFRRKDHQSKDRRGRDTTR